MENKHDSLPFYSGRKTLRYNFLYIFPLCFVILLFACSGKQVDGPGIDFEKEIYDFGKVNEGEIVSHTFKFRNNGTENLLIESVKPTCGCTIAGQYDREVKPGASGEIPVKLKTAGFYGKFSKVIKVLTNIPDKNEIILTLKVTVYTPINTYPNVLWLMPDNKTPVSLSGSFFIRNNTDIPLEILSVTPSQKNVTTHIIAITENKEYQIDVTVNPPFNHDLTKETLGIQTNNPEKEYINLEYQYQMYGDIIVYPRSIVFEPGTIDTALERIINVDNYFPEPISIVNPHITGGTLDYKIDEVVDGKTFHIKLLFPAGFVLKEKDTLAFTFQVKKDDQFTEYNIPIKVLKSFR